MRTVRVARVDGAERRRAFDRRALITLTVVLIAIPSVLVFAPLGGAGTPAQMLGVALFVLWLSRQMLGDRAARSSRALQIAALLLLASVLASYVAAATRPIPPIELSAADRGLISTVAWLGMLLFAASVSHSRADLDSVLRTMCLAGGLMATLGLVQFATKQPFTNYIHIPGLSSNAGLDTVTYRGDLTRPAGTAIHPIEFGAVLTMILPIALHYAMVDTRRSLAARWFPVAAIAAAVPIAISRSAIISAVIVMLVVFPTWSTTARRRGYLAVGLLVCTAYLLVPGLLGTLTHLFTGISSDSSAVSRADSYSLAAEFIRRAPIFGRGFRTFLPSYRILDNQYLLSTIETGVVGLAAILALMIVSVRTSVRVRAASADADTRGLAHALTASVVATACSFALYDALSFPMAASLLFVIMGMVGALYRVTANERVSSNHASPQVRESTGSDQR